MKPSSTFLTVAGLVIAGATLISGCKRNEPPESPQGAETSQTPAQTPAKQTPSKPSAVLEPPKPAEKRVFVATAFQARSDRGIHDFPVGTEVTLIGEEEGDYIIEYDGLRLRNARSFFSDSARPQEQPLNPVDSAPAPASPSPIAPTAVTPDIAASTGETPDTIPTEEDRKNSALLDSIRSLNEEIRSEQESDAAKPEAIEKLKRQRDKLSEELTETAKP